VDADREPVSVALVGFGYWGVNLARNIEASTRTRLVAVVESDRDRAEKASAGHPSAHVVDSLSSALGRVHIDAVVIATPAATHAPLAEEAMRAGLHVLIEKPFATSSDEAERLLRVATETDRMCVAGHTFLYSAPVRALRQRIVAGDLGDVRYLYSQRLNLGRVRSDCNALWNFGPHDVSIIIHLLDDRPVEVSGRGASYLQQGIDDVCFATMHFSSGVVANLHVSWLDPRKTRLMTVVGSEKMAVFDDVSADKKISIFDSGVDHSVKSQAEFSSMGDFQWRTRAGGIEIPHLALREPLLTEMDEFAIACRTGNPPVSDATSGRDVVRVLEAIDASCADDGRPVTISW
jgi:predicted dehydrogenase